MDENEMKKFFWPVFLIVTGICFFIFKKILFWLDGTQQPLFNWIGLVALLAGTLIGIFSFYKKSEKN